MGFCNCSMFCCTLLHVHSYFAIILMGKKERAGCLALFVLMMSCDAYVALPCGTMCLSTGCGIVVFPYHTHLLIFVVSQQYF